MYWMVCSCFCQQQHFFTYFYATLEKKHLQQDNGTGLPILSDVVLGQYGYLDVSEEKFSTKHFFAHQICLILNQQKNFLPNVVEKFSTRHFSFFRIRLIPIQEGQAGRQVGNQAGRQAGRYLGGRQVPRKSVGRQATAQDQARSLGRTVGFYDYPRLEDAMIHII